MKVHMYSGSERCRFCGVNALDDGINPTECVEREPVTFTSDTSRDEALEWLEKFCRENHYSEPQLMDDGIHYAAISRMMHTHAIILGEIGDSRSYLDRWCYADGLLAMMALVVWDGTGDPMGWHRHPKSGRRVSDGTGIDGNGNRVPMGEIYVNH